MNHVLHNAVGAEPSPCSELSDRFSTLGEEAEFVARVDETLSMIEAGVHETLPPYAREAVLIAAHDYEDELKETVSTMPGMLALQAKVLSRMLEGGTLAGLCEKSGGLVCGELVLAKSLAKGLAQLAGRADRLADGAAFLQALDEVSHIRRTSMPEVSARQKTARKRGDAAAEKATEDEMAVLCEKEDMAIAAVAGAPAATLYQFGLKLEFFLAHAGSKAFHALTDESKDALVAGLRADAKRMLANSTDADSFSYP